MRLLFELDYKDYKENGVVFRRPSVRAIIIKDNKIAMVYSKKYDYYKFPGGGIEPNESHFDALAREVLEETGLVIIPSSIKEYGLVVRKEAGKKEDIFLQENYYYLCDVSDEINDQSLDDYEEDEGVTLSWVYANDAIEINMFHDHGDKCSSFTLRFIERDVLVLKELIKEGIVN